MLAYLIWILLVSLLLLLECRWQEIRDTCMVVNLENENCVLDYHTK